MRVKINYHNGLYAALNYNYAKVEKGMAIELSHSQDLDPLNSDLKSTYILMKLRSNEKAIQNNTIHLSLNFQPGTPYDIEKMTKIQDEYIQNMGWSGLSYKSFLHTDRLHPHIHIVLVRERNVLKEFQKSKEVAQALIDKYDLIHEYDDQLNEQVQKMTVSNQVKFYLEKVQKAKNVYSIEEVQRLFNAMCPSFKMMVNPDKKTICFVQEFNASFLKSSDNQDPARKSLINLYKLWKKELFQQPQIGQITKEQLDSFSMLEPDLFVHYKLNELQLLATTATTQEFLKIFRQNFKGYQLMISKETHDIVFVNQKDKTCYSTKHIMNASSLNYKTTYTAWEEKLARNQKLRGWNEDKESTLPARNKIKDRLQEKLQDGSIQSFDDLKKAFNNKGLYFIFHGHKKEGEQEKQITGWSVYDEESAKVYKMSEIDRAFSFTNIAALFDERKKGRQRVVPMVPLKTKRLPANYFSPYQQENQAQYGVTLKTKFVPFPKAAAKSTSNSLSNEKTNERNNNNPDRSF